MTSPEQKMSPVSPVSTVSLDSRDEDLVLELSAGALKARTLPGDLSAGDYSHFAFSTCPCSAGFPGKIVTKMLWSQILCTHNPL